jgi:hypothetical protein
LLRAREGESAKKAPAPTSGLNLNSVFF